MTTFLRWFLSLALGAGLALAISSGPASAAARVGVTNEFGDAVADNRYATKLKLSGSGFQAIKNGYGGIYVFFGTVNGTWQPSRGGTSGVNYSYVPDSESQGNRGYQRLVAFQGSETAGAAQATMKADGSWSTTIDVPGAKFQAVGRDGSVKTVDCRRVTCGVITIGAHGVKNSRNETFTPVTFGDIYKQQAQAPVEQPDGTASSPPGQVPQASAQDPQAQPQAGAKASGPGGAVGATAPTKGQSKAKRGAATGSVDLDTAVVGRVITFDARGFEPGEQVTASFDQGEAALGPPQAGSAGEVAGALQLPPQTSAGTHALRLTGAASQRVVDINFPVKSDAAADSPDSASGLSIAELPAWAPWVALAVSVAALVVALLFLAFRWRRLRKVSGAAQLIVPEEEFDHVG